MHYTFHPWSTKFTLTRAINQWLNVLSFQEPFLLSIWSTLFKDPPQTTVRSWLHWDILNECILGVWIFFLSCSRAIKTIWYKRLMHHSENIYMITLMEVKYIKNNVYIEMLFCLMLSIFITIVSNAKFKSFCKDALITNRIKCRQVK